MLDWSAFPRAVRSEDSEGPAVPGAEAGVLDDGERLWVSVAKSC